MHDHDPVLGEPDAEDLDMPLRRELDAFYDDPQVDDRLRDALDAAYAIGRRQPAS